MYRLARRKPRGGRDRGAPGDGLRSRRRSAEADAGDNDARCQEDNRAATGAHAGTEFLNLTLRCLGARVGRRVHIHRGVDVLRGGWDLLDIGDDVTLARFAELTKRN